MRRTGAAVPGCSRRLPQDRRCGATYAVSSGVSFRCRQGVSFECRLTKIKEPSPGSWARRIGTSVRPLPFLAVPHHVEQRTMVKLTDDADAIVLDRLRLVRFKEDVVGDEQDVIRAVAGEDVEPLVG